MVGTHNLNPLGAAPLLIVSLCSAFVRYLRTLKLDKDLLSMKNFCIYDPMRQGRGLILDGQTLSHIEVLHLPKLIQNSKLTFAI